MNKLEDTLSLCEHCYRHVPAVRFERDGQIWLWKKCKFHGESEHLVEPDAEFYLNYNYPRKALNSYLIEVTNKCNLACPNCYQEPDNMSKDPSIDYLLSIIQSWPDDGKPVALCGAEPTVRKDERPTPTKQDRDWVKAHPEDRQKFINRFGVEP
jgi:uncharacterized radical SAM superfamily Fe-S cluster-containing enzyme